MIKAYQWVYRDLYKKNGKDHRCDSIIIELFQTITSMHSKKMPKIKSCFVEKKEFEFFGQFAVSFFLSFCIYRRFGGIAMRCRTPPTLAASKKKIVAEIQLFYIFLKNKQHFGIIKNLSFWWQPVFLSEMLMTWADCWGSPSLA